MLSIKIGIISSLLTVIIGAFGAHGLKEVLTNNKTLETFQTAVRYQMFHSITLIIVGVLYHLNIVDNKFPTYLFLGGIFIFSGSLYVLSITGIKWLGAITPIGGLLFILGWGFLFMAID